LVLASLACLVPGLKRCPVQGTDQSSVTEGSNYDFTLSALELAETVKAGCGCSSGKEESVEEHLDRDIG
jgi:hypothetical protein